jgi:hypothetical protein
MGMNNDTEVEIVLRRCYDAFNRRDLDSALAIMHPDVLCPNGWEGGWVQGREGVRHYWRRQWAELNPHVEPRAFSRDTQPSRCVRCDRVFAHNEVVTATMANA